MTSKVYQSNEYRQSLKIAYSARSWPKIGLTYISLLAWKVMVKGIYQIPPRMWMELLHSYIWCSDRVKLLNKNFTYAKGLQLYSKGIQCVDDLSNSDSRNFIIWDGIQEKFKLLPTEEGDWRELMDNGVTYWTLTQIPSNPDVD